LPGAVSNPDLYLYRPRNPVKDWEDPVEAGNPLALDDDKLGRVIAVLERILQKALRETKKVLYKIGSWKGRGMESYRNKVAREMGNLQNKFQKECDKALSEALAKSIRVVFGINQTRRKVASRTNTLFVSYIILNKTENPTGPGMYSRSCKLTYDIKVIAFLSKEQRPIASSVDTEVRTDAMTDATDNSEGSALTNPDDDGNHGQWTETADTQISFGAGSSIDSVQYTEVPDAQVSDRNEPSIG
jgi:hypothetical protein